MTDRLIGMKLNAFYSMKDVMDALENGAYDNFQPGKMAAESRLRNYQEILGITPERTVEDAKNQLVEDVRQYLLNLNLARYEDFGANYKSPLLTFTDLSPSTEFTFEIILEYDENLSPRIVIQSARWKSEVLNSDGTMNIGTIE